MDGILVPGGFGTRGIEGKIAAARFARENRVPYLGLCLGMQVFCIEFARYALEDERANSTEFDPSTPHPIIDLLPEQRGIADMGGTMRLGAYPCQLVAGTRAAAAYAAPAGVVRERHRHRFEFNNGYRDRLAAKGLVYSGILEDGNLGRSPNLPIIRSCSARNSIRNFSRAPTAPIPCSERLSPPPSSTPLALKPEVQGAARVPSPPARQSPIPG